MWQNNPQGSVIELIATVDEIEADNGDDEGFRLRGTFKEGGGQTIANSQHWHKIGGNTKTGRDGTKYTESYRERDGRFESPGGQFTMTKDLTKFDSDVDYYALANPRHATHGNSNILPHLDDHTNRYGPIPLTRVP